MQYYIRLQDFYSANIQTNGKLSAMDKPKTPFYNNQLVLENWRPADNLTIREHCIQMSVERCASENFLNLSNLKGTAIYNTGQFILQQWMPRITTHP